MATSSGAHIKHIRVAHKNAHPLTKSAESELSKKDSRKNSPFQLMQKTERYEKYCKYWSILSNVAAVVSVTSAIFNAMKKQRRWL